jgi:hypothetical protein
VLSRDHDAHIHENLVTALTEIAKLKGSPIQRRMERVEAFNACMQGLARRYPFPTHEAIRSAMQSAGIEGKIDPLLEKLRGLRKSVVEEGFFSFRPENA